MGFVNDTADASLVGEYPIFISMTRRAHMLKLYSSWKNEVLSR